MIDEAVFRRSIGGPKVLRGQLGHLAEMSDRPNIEIRVLPLATDAHPGLGGTFQSYEMPSLLTEIVLSDTLTVVVYVEGDSVAQYRRA